MEPITLDDDRVITARCECCRAFLYHRGGGFETVSGFICNVCAGQFDPDRVAICRGRRFVIYRDTIERI